MIEIGIGDAAISASASAIEIIWAEVSERQWRWLVPYVIGSAAVIVITSLYVSGWLALLVGAIAAVPLFYMGLRAVTRVRHVDKYL